MTNERYLRLIRQYAALAQRFGRSYAAPVNTIVQLRHDAIMAQDKPNDQRVQEANDAISAAQREYGRFDRDFQVDIIPF